MSNLNNFLLLIFFLSLDIFIPPLHALIIITVYFLYRFSQNLLKKEKIGLDEIIEFVFLLIFYLVDILSINDNYKTVIVLLLFYFFIELSLRRNTILNKLPRQLINEKLIHLMIYRVAVVNYYLLFLAVLVLLSVLLYSYFPDWVIYCYAALLMYLFYKNFHVLETVLLKIFFSRDELIPIIYENDQLMFNCPRKIAHRYKFPHPAVHLLLIDGNKLLLQKRSNKRKINPGLWDSSVGGHVKHSQNIEEALVTESREELSYDLTNFKFLQRYIIKEKDNFEYVYLFSAAYNNQKLKADEKEISEIRWWTLEEIEKERSEAFTKHFISNELVFFKKMMY